MIQGLIKLIDKKFNFYLYYNKKENYYIPLIYYFFIILYVFLLTSISYITLLYHIFPPKSTPPASQPKAGPGHVGARKLAPSLAKAYSAFAYSTDLRAVHDF